MAHTCPECGAACHCRGDIDDMLMDGGPEEPGCIHAACLDDDVFFDADWADAHD